MLKKLSGVKIARVGTVPFSLSTQLNSTMSDLRLEGAHVTAICSDDSSLGSEINNLKCDLTIVVDIPRNINFYRDILALLKLVSIFKAHKFDIIHSTTPKAGLLVAIAGFISRSPVRLHTFTGQVWVEYNGFKRLVFKTIDKLILSLNTHCFADSESQKSFLVNQNIGKEAKIDVLGLGSLSGVDLCKFDLHKFKYVSRKDLRKSVGIDENAFVFFYIGRLTKEKGIIELIEAFKRIETKYSNAALLLVGPIEPSFKTDIDFPGFGSCRIYHVGYTDEVEKYIYLSDVLCIPSHREGFGTVVIEAAAMRKPAIGSNIYGLCDAISDGNTGILFEKKCTDSLMNSMEGFIINQEFTNTLGNEAYQRALNFFDSKVMSKHLIRKYVALLRSSKR